MQPIQRKQFFSAWLQRLLLSAMFMLAFAIRLYYVTQPSFSFNGIREYRSLIIARGLYFDHAPAIPEWRKQIATLNQQLEGFTEAPIMEFLTVAIYQLVGNEYFWVPRLLSSIFWLVGGGALYLLAREMISANAALFSTAFYLFLPFGVTASATFMPDPLMIMLLLLSLWLILWYQRQPSTTRLLIAGIVSAMAIFIKLMALFFIFGVFVCLAIQREGIGKSLLKPKNWLFMAVALCPTIIFFAVNILLGGFTLYQGRFMPYLLLVPTFWQSWLFMIDQVIGYLALSGALLGLLLVPHSAKTVMMGLWGGYFVYGAIFTFHIHTHDYYQLPFIPIIALSLGILGDLLLTHLATIYQRWTWQIVIALIFLLTILLSLSQTRLLYPIPNDQRIKAAHEIGGIVNHSSKTILLAFDFGKSLRYHGEIAGSWWPSRFDLQTNDMNGLPKLSVTERFQKMTTDNTPDYFIVTNFIEFNAQPELKQFLISRFPVVAQTKDYLIFNLK